MRFAEAIPRSIAPTASSAHWPVVPLGEVGEIGTGITLGRRLPMDLTRQVPYLRVANVKDGYLDLRQVNQIEASEEEIERSRLRRGDLLLTEGGDPDKLGRGTVWDAQIPDCIHQNHIFRVRFDPLRVSPNFVSAQIASPYGKAYFLSHAKQTTGIATINQRVLRNFPLLLPSLAEQERIASTLSEQMRLLERARTGIRAQDQLAVSLVNSYLRYSLAGHTTRRLMLSDCLVEVKKGVGSDWQRYRVVGATRSGLAPAKEAVGKTPERYKLVEPGTIFYNPMRILLGSIATVENGDEPGITSPDYVVFRTKEGVLDPRWFYHWLRSLYGEAFIKTLTRGAVRERMLFRRLATAEIAIPDWRVQCEVGSRLTAVSRLRRSLADELSLLDTLPPSLLRQVFGAGDYLRVQRRPTLS